MISIVCKNGIILVGKVKHLKAALKELAKDYYSIQELIDTNLH